MLTENNKITVWGQTGCNYCEMAKRLLDSYELPYTYQMIGDALSKKRFYEETNGARSIPQIIVDGKLIGGYPQLKAMLDDQTN